MTAARPLGYGIVAVVWLHHVAIAYLASLSVAHVIVTPILAASLPVGVTTLARGRRLRMDDAADVRLLALVATGIWLLVPSFRLTCADGTAVVEHVAGLAVAVWLMVGVSTVVRRGALPAYAIPMTFAGLVVAATLARTPDLGSALAAASDSGHEWNLHLVNLAMRGSGVVGAVVMLVWGSQVAWSRWRGRDARPLADEDVAAMARALLAAVVLTAVVVVTTVPTKFDLVATGTALAVAVAYLVANIGDSRGGRIAIAIAVVVIHVVLVVLSIRTLDSRSGAGAAAPGDQTDQRQ